MKQRLVSKLDRLRADIDCGEFILADAKDADMSWGIASPGREAGAMSYRSMPEFRDQIMEIVDQGLVDIMLASVGTMSLLAHKDGRFDDTDITPAIRANDTTDVWVPRSGRYAESPSRPFASCYIEEAQFGPDGDSGDGSVPVVNLGLYSMTFNNDIEADHKSLTAFRSFRKEAYSRGFKYFLEVFAPNVRDAVAPEDVGGFVNDHICRTLAAVPVECRPEFLKIPYFGPASLEELVNYDPGMIVGVLGGGSGTTYDAFLLLSDARKHGARVALFGRKIKNAEHSPSFIKQLRLIADGDTTPDEAVRAYHADLKKLGVEPKLSLSKDMELSDSTLSYAG